MTLLTSQGLLEPRPALKLNEENLLAYLKQNVAGFAADLRHITVKQCGYGQSNPTYFIQAPANSAVSGYILRKKPPGELLKSAHDVEREFRVLSALGSVPGSGLPLPRVICLCQDSSVIGTSFYIMEHVEGRVFKDIKLPDIQANERQQAYHSMSATLAALHSIDPLKCGLKDYGKHSNYAGRTLKRWKGQYDKSAMGEAKTPAMDALADWLFSNLPPEPEHISVVHGDFKLDNLVYHPTQPHVTAVLDWELSTLGDPLADLGYACMPYSMPPTKFPYTGFPLAPDGSLLLPDGIPTEQQFVATYCQRRNVQVPTASWSFYLALAMFRAASISAGVYARSQMGNASSDSAHLAGPMVGILAQRALAVVKGVSVPRPVSDAGALHIPGLGMSPLAEGLMEKLVRFMREEVMPHEAEIHKFDLGKDRWTIHPVKEDLKAKARAAGLWNLWISKSMKALLLGYKEGFEEELLGPGLTNLDYAHLCEVMGMSFLGPETFNCSAPDTGNMEVLARYGTPGQRATWLRPLLEGKIRSCFGMTEPAVASSDATNITSKIQKVNGGSGYVLNGEKWWTSGASDPRCKICIFMGKTRFDGPVHQQQSMILCPMDAPGVKIEEDLTVYGFDDAPHGHARVSFTNVSVPATNMLLGEGRGFEIAQGRLGPGRLHHCMRCIGAAERGMDIAKERVTTRKVFGKMIVEHGSVQQQMAECRLLIQQSRLVVLEAARQCDTIGNKKARAAIALAKVSAPRTTLHVLDWAVQQHGGAGVSNYFMLAHLWASVRTLRIADGPDEVHLRDLSRMELKKKSKL